MHVCTILPGLAPLVFSFCIVQFSIIVADTGMKKDRNKTGNISTSPIPVYFHKHFIEHQWNTEMDEVDIPMQSCFCPFFIPIIISNYLFLLVSVAVLSKASYDCKSSGLLQTLRKGATPEEQKKFLSEAALMRCVLK